MRRFLRHSRRFVIVTVFGFCLSASAQPDTTEALILKQVHQTICKSETAGTGEAYCEAYQVMQVKDFALSLVALYQHPGIFAVLRQNPADKSWSVFQTGPLSDLEAGDLGEAEKIIPEDIRNALLHKSATYFEALYQNN